MSHAAEIFGVEFTDLACLKKAFGSLGWSIKENANIRTYRNDPARNRTFTVVAVNPDGIGAFDIGVDRAADGHLALVADYSMARHSFEKSLGKDYGKLKQAYAVQKFTAYAATHKGKTFTRALRNGAIRMEVEVTV